MGIKKNIPISCFILLFSFLLFQQIKASACTIASAVASNGHVWNCNNEDGPLGVANFITVFPKSTSIKYGYFTLSYFSPKLGEGSSIQGGMNEAGLTFDFNGINTVKGFDQKKKKAFHLGDEQILPYILGNMSSVTEVIEFFETYWFQNGFVSAQMHIADKYGRFAMISASGIKMVQNGEFLVSTNFDICGKEDSTSCSRYPTVTSILKNQDAGFNTMMEICKRTSGEITMYSNIQNLTTGEVWFFSKHDPEVMVKTNITDLLSKGPKSYTFSDLNSLIENRSMDQLPKTTRIEVADNIKEKYFGAYNNDFTGQLIVEAHQEGIKVTSSDGNANILQSQSENTFFFPSEEVKILFRYDKQKGRMILSFYENGFWSFDAWRPN
jgi:penicillin V acylase-like amidase (Ntn superfamily)